MIHFIIFYWRVFALASLVVECSQALCFMYPKYRMTSEFIKHTEQSIQCFVLQMKFIVNYGISVRGRLGSILPLARNSGILIAFIAGALIKYEHRPYVFIFIPIIYLVWVFFLPNSPQFYLKNNKFQVSTFQWRCQKKKWEKPTN